MKNDNSCQTVIEILDESANLTDYQKQFVLENWDSLVEKIEKQGGLFIPRRLPNKYHANKILNAWYLMREKHDSSHTTVTEEA